MGQVEGDGFNRQRIAIGNFAAANGYEIAQWFEERGVSGKTEWEQRPAWVDMVSQFNGVRTIIIERLDRLARDLFIQEYVLKDLKKRGVVLLTAAGEETGDADPTRVLFRQILGAISAYDRANIVLKLRSARSRKKAQTGRCEGRKPYGNTEAERVVLCRIVNEKSNAKTPTEIARALNAEGVPPRSGKQWTAWTVNRILRREQC